MKSTNSLKSIAFVFFAMFVVAACNDTTVYSDANAMVDAYKINIEEIRPEALMQKIDSGEMILLIDVRDKMEHVYGYIPGSVNISRGTLEFKMGNAEFWENQFLYLPEKTEEIIVYCKKGKRGILAANALKKLGYSNIKNLMGGWKEWELTYPLIFEKNLEEISHEPAEEEGGC